MVLRGTEWLLGIIGEKKRSFLVRSAKTVKSTLLPHAQPIRHDPIIKKIAVKLFRRAFSRFFAFTSKVCVFVCVCVCVWCV